MILHTPVQACHTPSIFSLKNKNKINLFFGSGEGFGIGQSFFSHFLKLIYLCYICDLLRDKGILFCKHWL